MGTMTEKIIQLKEILNKIEDLNHTNALLDWDHQVYIPPSGTEERSEMMTTISEISHNFATSDELGKLIYDLEEEFNSLDPNSDDYALVRVAKRNYERETKIPSQLIIEFSKITSVASSYWKKAREADDFKQFEPHLNRIVDLTKAIAECFSPYEHVYDPFLDKYEPGITTKEVKQIFETIRPQQVALIKAISERPQVDDTFLHQHFPFDKQWEMVMFVAEKFGLSWDRSRQDRSAHPFTTSFGQNDVRITTKIQENLPMSGLFSTMHETGHALYELGFDPKHRRTPLSSSASAAFHESQSRMWENIIGRSRDFWRYFYPIFQNQFHSQLDGVSLDSFYKAINKVEPSLIRTEADEATYNLHVMLRFEIEMGLLDGSVEVKSLPELWNTLMKEYLGVTPDSDKNGVLQDIHWSWGMIGYFPTYALGNIISVQLWEKIISDIPKIHDRIITGEFSEVREWLRENVQKFGAKYYPQDLIERITGSSINPKPYINYLSNKYSEIYDL